MKKKLKKGKNKPIGILEHLTAFLERRQESFKGLNKKAKSGNRKPSLRGKNKKKAVSFSFRKLTLLIAKKILEWTGSAIGYIQKENWSQVLIVFILSIIMIVIILIAQKPSIHLVKGKVQEAGYGSAASSAQTLPAEKVFFGRVAFVQGEVRYQNPGDTNWKALKEGQSLFRDSTVKTGKYSEAEVTVADNGIIKFMDNTSIRLAKAPDVSNSRPAAVDLRQGKIYYQGNVGTPGMTISVGDTAVSAKGAQLSVDNTGNTVKVAVIEGAAIVNTKGNPLPVRKNQGFVKKPGDIVPAVFDLPSAPQPVRLRSH